MSEFVTVLQGAGGGVLAGGLAWFLFYKSNTRNEKLVDDRMNALEKAAQACEADRAVLNKQFHDFKDHFIDKQSTVMHTAIAHLTHKANYHVE